MTYQEWRQKCSQRREERSEQAAWLGVRSVTGLKLRLRAGRWGGDEEQRSADWNEPLSAGRQGGAAGSAVRDQAPGGAERLSHGSPVQKTSSLPPKSGIHPAAGRREAPQRRPAAQVHHQEHLHPSCTADVLVSGGGLTDKLITKQYCTV